MKKINISLAIISFLLIFIVACNNTNNSKSESETINNENVVVVIGPKETPNNSTVSTTENSLPSEKNATSEIECDDECKLNNANKTGNADLCNQIASVKIKNICFYELGVAKKSIDICTKISDLTKRQNCYDLIGYKPKKEIEEKETFQTTDSSICKENDIPKVVLYSATWCPHCKWIAGTYKKVAQEYSNKGLISAHLWEINTGDDVLTQEIEYGMPEEDITYYKETNPRGNIPYFSFGCKYIRIGTGYEDTQDLAAEENEFRKVIDKLIFESQN